MAELVSSMLRLFRDGASYQPEVRRACPRNRRSAGFAGKRPTILMRDRPGIVDILVRPTGVLFVFLGGEQYYAPGLRVGIGEPACEALAQIAAKAGFGSYEDLLRHYRALPADYIGPL